MIILVVLITLLVCIFFCVNEYRRRRRHRSISFNDGIEQIQQEPSLLDTHYPQISRPSSPSSGPQLWINTIRRWKNFRHELPSYSPAQTTQPASVTVAPTAATIPPTDEPPSYEGIFIDFYFFIITYSFL